jgi:hypothetical protein
VAILRSYDLFDSPFYVDIFNEGRIYTEREILGTLAELNHLNEFEVRNPATVSKMLLRVAQNVINAINRRPKRGAQLAWLSALSCLSILDPDELCPRQAI